MDNYLHSHREMISLRGLTDHTVQSYSTYIPAYLGYLRRVLRKKPEVVSWEELLGHKSLESTMIYVHLAANRIKIRALKSCGAYHRSEADMVK